MAQPDQSDRIAVIIQPMYIPWMGYFGYIEQADVFVYYDDVQFVRRSWHRRNKVKVSDGDFTWLTVPVVKNFGQKINEVKIRNNEDWQEDHWKTIHHSYANAPYYDDYKEDLKRVYLQEWRRLSKLNETLIKLLVEKLGIGNTEFVLSSNTNTEGAKTDRLINILRHVGADAYISGPTAKDYLNVEKFRAENITLYWHEFDHPVYQQPHGEFVPHLSTIDLLFNEGPNARSLIKQGERNALRRDTRT